MILYIIDKKLNYTGAPWEADECFKRIKDAQEYIERMRSFYSFCQFRMSRFKMEKRYE